MKKIYLLASLLIAVIFISGCKKKDEPTNVTDPEVEQRQSQTIAFYVGDSVAIDTFDGKGVNYSSDNEFVAKVENDIAIAKHVGTARLTADDKLYSADVTVLPRYRFFQEPVKTWGIDTTTLLEAVLPLKPVRPFCLDSAGVRSMYGFLRMPNVEAVLYYFEDNQLKLAWSLIPQKDSIQTHMTDFLTERYEYMNSRIESTLWSDAMVHRYINAYSPVNADLIVAHHEMTLDETAYLIEGMFGTRNLLGLVYQDANLHQFDTAWVDQYINGLPSRLKNQNQ